MAAQRDSTSHQAQSSAFQESRRHFLKVAAACSTVTLPNWSWSSRTMANETLAKNDRPRVGCIRLALTRRTRSHPRHRYWRPRPTHQ